MYKNSKFAIILPIVVACSVILGVLISGTIIKPSPNSQGRRTVRYITSGGNKIDALMTFINTRYVDTVNMDSLTERVMPLLLEELDPHSVYIPAKDFGNANESLEGEFDGIGIVFNMTTDTVIVMNVITGGPSMKAGIMGGDRIIRIDDTTVAGVKMDQDAVVKRLRGPRGTKVNLGIQRVGIDELIPITVTRDKVPIKSITAAYMIEPGIGYINFKEFSRNSHAELMEAVSSLQQQGMRKLILDIRGNGGGYMDPAITISNEFLPDKKLIVYQKDRIGKEIRQYSDGRGRLTGLGLVLLIDEGSASSSEIFAGALQDHDRAILIGRRSFGKGLIQEQIPFGDGSAVRLTIARYYTPSGRSIQKPYSDGKEQYYNELFTRYEHNEFFTADSIQFKDTVKYYTDSGRVVHGGGGIMPDVFVPQDTVGWTVPYFRDAIGKNILYRYTIDYSDRHRAELNKIGSLKEMDDFFAKDPDILNGFVAFASRAGLAPDYKGIERSGKLLMAYIKAYIGRNTPLEDNAYYHALQPIDNVMQKALEEVK